jgi:hypothetical protein
MFAWAALPLCAAVMTARAQERPKAPEPPPGPEDLSGRLIRKAASDSEEDLMDGIIRLMGDAARKVEIDFDPGPQTQSLQQTIQTKLDEAIKAAASRQRSKQVAPPSNPDRRRMPLTKREPPPAKPPAPAKPQPSAASEGSAAEGSAQPKDKDQEPGELHDVRRGWGHLPQREREEIIQGVGEGFLERYRVWVERYYRALQEKDQ